MWSKYGAPVWHMSRIWILLRWNICFHWKAPDLTVLQRLVSVLSLINLYEVNKSVVAWIEVMMMVQHCRKNRDLWPFPKSRTWKQDTRKVVLPFQINFESFQFQLFQSHTKHSQFLYFKVTVSVLRLPNKYRERDDEIFVDKLISSSTTNLFELYNCKVRLPNESTLCPSLKTSGISQQKARRPSSSSLTSHKKGRSNSA